MTKPEVALPLHCPECGKRIKIGDLIHEIIRETILELDRLATEDDETDDPQPEQPDPQQDPHAAGLW